MQLVPNAPLHPGCCALCRSAVGPFVDTGRTGNDGRVYVCRSCDRDVHEVMATLHAPAELTPDRREDVELELAALRDRFNELVAAVHLTLREGAVIRRGKIALRSQRGQVGFDLGLDG